MRLIFAVVLGGLEGSLQVDQLIEVYDKKYQRCSHTPSIDEDELAGGCPPKAFKIWEEADPIKIGSVIGRGATGVVLQSQDGRFAIKIPSAYAQLELMKTSMCRERAMLDYVKSVTGGVSFVPSLYHTVANRDTGPCWSLLVVTNKVGPYTFLNLQSSVGSVIAHNKAEIVRIGVRLLDLVSSLYAIRVTHGDLNAGNIMFSDPLDIAGSLVLIDFGSAKFLHASQDHSEDLLSALLRLADLSKDRFGNADAEIVRIYNSVSDRSDEAIPGLIEFAISELLSINTEPRASPHGVRVTDDDQSNINWFGVSRVRDALYKPVDLETYLKTTQKLKRITLDEFRLEDGIKIGGHLVRFPPKDAPCVSTDGYFRCETAEEFRIEEFIIAKRLDVIFRDNGIPTFTSVVDDWIEGQNLIVDAMAISLNRAPLMNKMVDTWNFPQTDSPHQLGARVAVTMLRLLEGMHDIGLVHGDIDPSKIFGLANSDGRILNLDNLVLESTHWGRMYLAKDGTILPQDLSDCRKDERSSQQHSPAQLAGFCPGRFDDLYRLSESLFMLITGTRKKFGKARSNQALIALKQDWRIENAPRVFNSFHDDMFSRSHNLDTSRPDYSGWIEKFQAVVNNSN